MPLELFLKSMEGLHKWVDLLLKNKIDIREQEQAAIDALHAALCKTQLYTASLRKGQALDREQEATIAELWHHASSKLTFIDSDLSSLCMLKGTYWSEPDLWTDTDIAQARIALTNITEGISELKDRLAVR